MIRFSCLSCVILLLSSVMATEQRNIVRRKLPAPTPVPTTTAAPTTAKPTVAPTTAAPTTSKPTAAPTTAAPVTVLAPTCTGINGNCLTTCTGSGCAFAGGTTYQYACQTMAILYGQANYAEYNCCACPTPAPTSAAPTTASPTSPPTTAAPTTPLPTGPPTSMAPTPSPTSKPTSAPTSASPTVQPSVQPSSTPTVSPSTVPTSLPTVQPTSKPTTGPSAAPSAVPTALPLSVTVKDVSGSTQHSTSDKITLTATATSGVSPVMYQWSLVGTNVTLSTTQAFTVALLIPPNNPQPYSTVSLNPGVFPAQALIVMGVTVTDSVGTTASASISITTRAAPSGGVVSITSAGLSSAGIETFTLSATGWHDSAGSSSSLNYTWSYMAVADITASKLTEIWLVGAATSSVVMPLPVGALTVFSHVIDQYGASSIASGNYTVAPPSASSMDAMTLTIKTLNGATIMPGMTAIQSLQTTLSMASALKGSTDDKSTTISTSKATLDFVKSCTLTQAYTPETTSVAMEATLQLLEATASSGTSATATSTSAATQNDVNSMAASAMSLSTELIASAKADGSGMDVSTATSLLTVASYAIGLCATCHNSADVQSGMSDVLSLMGMTVATGEAQTVSLPNISASVAKVLMSTTGTQGVTVNAGTGGGAISLPGGFTSQYRRRASDADPEVQIELLSVNIQANPNAVSGTLSANVLVDGAAVTSFTNPLQVALPLQLNDTTATLPAAVFGGCMYQIIDNVTGVATGNWSHEGVLLAGVKRVSVNGITSVVATCNTTHLTDFAVGCTESEAGADLITQGGGTSSPSSMRIVSEFQTNPTAAILLLAITALAFTGFTVQKRLRKARRRLEQLQESVEEEYDDMYDNEELYDMEEMYAEYGVHEEPIVLTLQDEDEKDLGTFGVIRSAALLVQEEHTYIIALRSRHMVPLMVVLIHVLSILAVQALLFGRLVDSLEQWFGIVMISIAVTLPISTAFPYMFSLLNEPPHSSTLGGGAGHRWAADSIKVHNHCAVIDAFLVLRVFKWNENMDVSLGWAAFLTFIFTCCILTLLKRDSAHVNFEGYIKACIGQMVMYTVQLIFVIVMAVQANQGASDVAGAASAFITVLFKVTYFIFVDVLTITQKVADSYMNKSVEMRITEDDYDLDYDEDNGRGRSSQARERVMWAVIKLQCIWRGKLAKKQTIRRMEFRAWREGRKSYMKQWHLNHMLYTLIALYLCVTVGICSTFVVYFDARTTKGWLFSALVAIILDAFVRRPLFLVLKAAVNTIHRGMRERNH